MTPITGAVAGVFMQSNAADLDLRIVEACAFGEIGLEIRRDQSRNCLPGAARRPPRTFLTGNDTRRHIPSHYERQDDLAAVIPEAHLDAVTEVSPARILGVHQERR